MKRKKTDLPYNPDVAVVRIVTGLHILSDIIAFVTSYFLTYIIRFYDFEGSYIVKNIYSHIYIQNIILYISVGLVFLLFNYYMTGMYDGYKKLNPTHVFENIILSSCVVVILASASMYFARKHWHMRGFIPLALLINIPVALTFKIIVNRIIYMIRRHYGVLIYKSLLIGYTKNAEDIKEKASKSRIKGFRIARHIASPEDLNDLAAVEEEIKKDDISVVMSMDENLSTQAITGIMQLCIKYNKTFKTIFSRFDTLKNPFDENDSINGYTIVHFNCLSMSRENSFVNDIFSRMLSFVFIIILSPVLLLISVLIKAESCGSAVFKQLRYGVNGKPFTMYKYRTMKINAENDIEKLWEKNESDGALFKIKDDPRVTKLGALLRKTSLDELLQLVNVLKGEMRFIGPRPLPVADLHKYKYTWHFLRQIGYPGMSCIWQITGRSILKFEDMCLLDIWYVLNRNWMLDLKIFIRTIWSVLLRKGAY